MTELNPTAVLRPDGQRVPVLSFGTFDEDEVFVTLRLPDGTFQTLPLDSPQIAVIEFGDHETHAKILAALAATAIFHDQGPPKPYQLNALCLLVGGLVTQWPPEAQLLTLRTIMTVTQNYMKGFPNAA